MSWAAMIPVVLACFALLFVPGGALALVMGLRGLPAAAAAPALTICISATSAIAAGLLGLQWTVLPLCGVAGLLIGVAWLLRYWFGSTLNNSSENVLKRRLWPILGFAVGSCLLLWQLTRVFGQPENISQTFDGIFHLNAVQYALDTGNASSLTLTAMTNGDNPPYFYPAAWHGLVALLVQITGTSIAAAANGFNIVVAAVMWALGCMLLVRTVAGPKPQVVAFGGTLAAGFSAFPLLLLDFGVLYPNFLSISMLPVGLSAVAAFFGVGQLHLAHPIPRYALAPLIAVGIAVAHPNGAMTLLAVSVPVGLFAYLRRYVLPGHAMTSRKESGLVAGAMLVGLLILGLAWKFIRPPADAAFWQRYRSPLGGAWEVVTNSAMGRPVALVVSLLVVLGLYSALRNRDQWWIVGSYAIVAALFVVIVGFPDSYLRNALTGVWYNDSYRLAAVLPLAAVPLAALGFERVLKTGQALLEGLITKMDERVPPTTAMVRLNVGGGVLVAVMLVIGMQGPPINYAVGSAAKNYLEYSDSEVVSSDEMELIEQLDTLVPTGETIAVNPWTGAALAYALADRPTTSRHVLSTYPADVEVINNSLRNALTDPAVCPAVQSTGVRYVLDFGSKEVHGGDHSFPGLEELQSSPAAVLVAQVGEAKLFEITACVD